MNDYLTRREIFRAFTKSLDDIRRIPMGDESTAEAEIDALHHFYLVLIRQLDAKSSTDAPTG